jgi:hypothetical protein
VIPKKTSIIKEIHPCRKKAKNHRKNAVFLKKGVEKMPSRNRFSFFGNGLFLLTATKSIKMQNHAKKN